MAEANPHPLRLREFFLARQPILDCNQELVAYELLFRHAEIGPANVTDNLSATASVIAHTAQLGLEKVIGNARGFINVDASALMSDIFQFLPRDKVILEIVETVTPTDDVLARIVELRQEGFSFALDDVIVDSDEVKKFLPVVDIVKFDLRDMPLSALLKLPIQFQLEGKKLLAEKVETFGQFKICKDLNFDYFQGYYFAKPSVLSGKKLTPSHLSLIELMNQLMSDADNAVIEKTIKQNVAMGLNLLRLANTPAIGSYRRIDSLSHALMILGRKQLQRWLQIMLYTDPGEKGESVTPLLILATTRGKMLELMAQKIDANNRHSADIAFTVGIMSLMDSLFSLPMQAILEQIPVIEEVSDALLSRQGWYGDLLTLTEHLEQLEETETLIAPLMTKLQLSKADLYELQLTAFEWSNQVAQATH